MSMDGEPASPLQIVNAHMAKESNAYMRDYVMDDETGSLKELHFQKIAAKQQRSPQCRVLRNSYYFLKKRKVCSNLSKKETLYGIIGQVGGRLWIEEKMIKDTEKAGQKDYMTEDDEEEGHA